MSVRTPDSHDFSEAWKERALLDIEENRGPIRLTPEEAVEKVRRLLVDKFGLTLMHPSLYLPEPDIGVPMNRPDER